MSTETLSQQAWRIRQEMREADERTFFMEGGVMCTRQPVGQIPPDGWLPIVAYDDGWAVGMCRNDDGLTMYRFAPQSVQEWKRGPRR